MTFLVVLDQNPKTSAELMADIHLRHSITRAAQFLSTAIIEETGTLPTKNADGVMEYRYDGILLLPPVRDPRHAPWVKWLRAEYQRIWWLISYAWLMDKERLARFEADAPHDDYLMIGEWIKKNIPQVFTKNKLPVSDFPIVLPPSENMLLGRDPILTYQDYYKSLYAQRWQYRMKWTVRDIPSFLGEVTTIVTSS